MSKSIAIFASGNGTNALNICAFFKNSNAINVEFIVCNNPNAPIVLAAKELGLEVVIFSNVEIETPSFLSDFFQKRKLDLIVLAGFLRKIPLDLVQLYPDKIVNIHPALLPNYGGPGMYGKFVHEAVLKNQEKTHGITIHLVNEEYDKGKILAQFSCELTEKDDLASVQGKIHALEMQYFPQQIQLLLQD